MDAMRAHAGTEIFRVLGQKMLVHYHRPAGRDGQRFPTVLFLHGFPGSEKSSDVQRALMARGIASIAPSFLGAWGRGGRYRFTTLVPQARAALRAAKRLPFVASRRVAVFGFSMGGWPALTLAALEPALKAVVAVAPCGGPEMIGPQNRSFIAHLSRPLNAPAPGALVSAFRRAMREFEPALAEPRQRAPLQQVHGAEDETNPPTNTKHNATHTGKHKRHNHLRGGDHGLLDCREKLARLASDFLSSRV